MNPAAARQQSPWTTRQKIGRALWYLAQATLFRWSPRTCFRWRNWLLNRFGATIHPTAHVYPTVKIEVPWHLTIGAYSSIGDGARLYCLGLVTIGERVTVSQFAHLCAGTHDYSDPMMPLLTPPISVEDDSWIAADAFVGPGVIVAPGTIVGARAVLTKSFDSWVVVVGNPARVVKRRERPTQSV